MTTTAEVEIYLVAHADDWQLFMSPQALEHLERPSPNAQTVFIHLTAGDDGFDRTFWRGREIGALNSILYAMGQPSSIDQVEHWTEVNDHAIATYTIDDRVHAYFLRLPDGNMDGSGFATTNGISLRAVHVDDRHVESLGDASCGDRTARYSGWADLVDTIAALIDSHIAHETREHSGLHFLDPRLPATPAPGHSHHVDHVETGLLAEAIVDRCRVKPTTYLDYDSSFESPNVHGHELQRKTGMFLAYNFYARLRSDDRYPATALDPQYQGWLERQIVTSFPPPGSP